VRRDLDLVSAELHATRRPARLEALSVDITIVRVRAWNSGSSTSLSASTPS
jgi:hypothetical protein